MQPVSGAATGFATSFAAEDLQFRRDNDGRLLERLFSVNVYHNAYEGMWLDKYAEFATLAPRRGADAQRPRQKASRQSKIALTFVFRGLNAGQSAVAMRQMRKER